MSEHIVGGVTQLTATPETDLVYKNALASVRPVKLLTEKCRDLESRLADAIRERDELQARLDSQIDECKTVHAESISILSSRAITAESERDEARAALREAIELERVRYKESKDWAGSWLKRQRMERLKRWRKAAGLEDGQ